MNMLKNILDWFKRHDLVRNAAEILAILVVMAFAAHLLMGWATRHGARRIVPDLGGIHFDDAARLLEETDLRITINDSLYVPAYDGGIVLDQLPKAGTEVKPDRMIYVTINAFSRQMVDVPYVAGRSLRQARSLLELAQLQIERIVYREDMATNYVLEQMVGGKTVKAGSKMKAEAGSGVVLYVGLEDPEELTRVPQAIGHTLREAKSRLWECGLNVGKIRCDGEIDQLEEKSALVSLQSIGYGREVAYGSTVDLTISLDRRQVERSRIESDTLYARHLREQERLRRQQRDSLQQLGEPAEPAEEEPIDESEFFD